MKRAVSLIVLASTLVFAPTAAANTSAALLAKTPFSLAPDAIAKTRHKKLISAVVNSCDVTVAPDLTNMEKAERVFQTCIDAADKKRAKTDKTERVKSQQN